MFQRTWLNDYHQKCCEKIGKFLQDAGKTDAYNWLISRTDPVPMRETAPCNGGRKVSGSTTELPVLAVGTLYALISALY